MHTPAPRVAIIGSGGHGREVLQVLLAARHGQPGIPTVGVEFAGFFDDAPDEHLLQRNGWPLLGDVETARRFDGLVYVGVGDSTVRERLATGLTAAPAIVHPLADVGTDVRLGDGTVVFAQSTVTTNIDLGAHVHVGRGAAVGHDTGLAGFTSVMPLASISGNVTADTGVFVGTGALVRQGVHLGAGCTVGMGAVVLSDVEAGSVVVGNPARPIRTRRPPNHHGS